MEEKKVLITAGPTSTPLDDVRLITNRFSGYTGILLSKEAVKKGYHVELLLGKGPFALNCEEKLSESIGIERFVYFDELKSKLFEKLKRNQYHIVIHSAAVNDFALSKGFKGKISSEVEALNIELKRTPKLLDSIRDLARKSILVSFKLEIDLPKEQLFEKARQQAQRTDSDYVVANYSDSSTLGYKAYILKKGVELMAAVDSKEEMVEKLFYSIKEEKR